MPSPVLKAGSCTAANKLCQGSFSWWSSHSGTKWINQVIFLRNEMKEVNGMIEPVGARWYCVWKGGGNRFRKRRSENQIIPSFQHLGRLCQPLSFPNVDSSSPQSLSLGKFTSHRVSADLSWWVARHAPITWAFTCYWPRTSPVLRNLEPPFPVTQKQLRPARPMKTLEKSEALNAVLPHVKVKNQILWNSTVLT